MYQDAYLPLLLSVARTIQAPADSLKQLIQAESGWDPAAYNKSGAVGLLQFMPQTLKSMRLLPSDLDAAVPAAGAVPEEVKQKVREAFLLKYPTVESQLQGPVQQYLLKGAPYTTEQSLFLQVFYPAYRFVPTSLLFPAAVRNANPGIDTVQDYIDFVKKKPKPSLWRRLKARFSSAP